MVSWFPRGHYFRAPLSSYASVVRLGVKVNRYVQNFGYIRIIVVNGSFCGKLDGDGGSLQKPYAFAQESLYHKRRSCELWVFSFQSFTELKRVPLWQNSLLADSKLEIMFRASGVCSCRFMFESTDEHDEDESLHTS